MKGTKQQLKLQLKREGNELVRTFKHMDEIVIKKHTMRQNQNCPHKTFSHSMQAFSTYGK